MDPDLVHVTLHATPEDGAFLVFVGGRVGGVGIREVDSDEFAGDFRRIFDEFFRNDHVLGELDRVALRDLRCCSIHRARPWGLFTDLFEVS